MLPYLSFVLKQKRKAKGALTCLKYNTFNLNNHAGFRRVSSMINTMPRRKATLSGHTYLLRSDLYGGMPSQLKILADFWQKMAGSGEK